MTQHGCHGKVDLISKIFFPGKSKCELKTTLIALSFFVMNKTAY